MNQIVNLCNAYTGFEGKKVFADSWIYVYVYQFVVFFEGTYIFSCLTNIT